MREETLLLIQFIINSAISAGKNSQGVSGTHGFILAKRGGVFLLHCGTVQGHTLQLNWELSLQNCREWVEALLGEEQ